MKRFKFLPLMLLFMAVAQNAFCQQSAEYKRAGERAEAAAIKYDALGCRASADYCRKIKRWCDCVVTALAGGSTICGEQPSWEDMPKCDEATIGGNSTSSSNSASDPFQKIPLEQQQEQQDLNVAQQASTAAYENAINSGRKESGAMVEATLAGAQEISDPKSSLAFTGIGVGVAVLSWISEKKEDERNAMLKREEKERLMKAEELRNFKESLRFSSTAFDFIRGSTDYHFTNLKIEVKHGMIKSILRKDLYDANVTIHSVINKSDTLYIYESVKFINLKNASDSCVITKISIPINSIKEVQIFSGDLTNAFDPKSNTNQIFRHKNLTNADIKEAFTIVPIFNEGNQIGAIHSNLNDINIICSNNCIKIQKKYSSIIPSSLTDLDFEGINYSLKNSYPLIFDDVQSNVDRANKFADYLNYIKN